MHSENSSPSAQRQLTSARILSRTEGPTNHIRWTLECAPVARGAVPGQFVHVLPDFSRPNSSSLSHTSEADHLFPLFDPLLRRAFSIMTTDAKASTFEMLFRVEGRGTRLMSEAQSGDSVNLIGPLGRGFDLNLSDKTLFHVKQEDTPNLGHTTRQTSPILVGGGVGVPPMIFLAQRLREFAQKPRVLVGARSANEVIGIDDFKALELLVEVATDDGSAGTQGLVTQLLEAALNHERSVVYACGPYPMLRAIARICEKFDVPCQVSLEENMPCGVGVCNGCVVAVRPNASTCGDDSDSPYSRFRRVCVEGPVCMGSEVEWN